MAIARKPVTFDIALAPLCGLLLCCAFFLLITARFDDIVAMRAVPSWPSRDALRDPGVAVRKLRVHLGAHRFVVSTRVGDRFEIPRIAARLDQRTLCERVRRFVDAHPSLQAIAITPEDAIPFEEIIATLDALQMRPCSQLARSARLFGR